jgi:hypothetical protein
LFKVIELLKDVPLLLLVLAAGCTTLPEYARPKMVPADTLRNLSSTGFTYRPLTIADFKATDLSRAMGTHQGHVNAHSCIQIRPTADTRFSIVPQHFYGTVQYFGSIAHIGFEALLIPECSWWNPRMPKNMHAYVLQHEQIHFAISELAARRLTAKARRLASTYLVIGATRQEELSELQARVKSLLKEALSESLKEHTAFDEDASMSPNPRQQNWWYREVTARLKRGTSLSN